MKRRGPIEPILYPPTSIGINGWVFVKLDHLSVTAITTPETGESDSISAQEPSATWAVTSSTQYSKHWS